MKRASITGVKKADLKEIPVPSATGNKVLVKVHVAPMCAEYKSFVEGTPLECLGHESAGEVIEVDHPGPVQVGDRVVCMPTDGCGLCQLCLSGDYIYCENNGMQDVGMSQYVLKSSFLLKKIPDDISYEKASLACCGLGASFGAMQALDVTAFDTVLITGLGPVGLGAVVNAKFRGARVIVVESNEYRVRLAEDLGVSNVVDPRDPDAVQKIKELCGGSGPDYAVDCSGVVAAHRLCIDAVRHRGSIVFVGESHTETPVTISKDMIRKGIRLIGSWHYNLNDFPQLMQVIRHSPLADKLITHVFPMSEIEKAFETSAGQNCAKILLKPWE